MNTTLLRGGMGGGGGGGGMKSFSFLLVFLCPRSPLFPMLHTRIKRMINTEAQSGGKLNGLEAARWCHVITSWNPGSCSTQLFSPFPSVCNLNVTPQEWIYWRWLSFSPLPFVLFECIHPFSESEKKDECNESVLPNLTQWRSCAHFLWRSSSFFFTSPTKSSCFTRLWQGIDTHSLFISQIAASAIRRTDESGGKVARLHLSASLWEYNKNKLMNFEVGHLMSVLGGGDTATFSSFFFLIFYFYPMRLAASPVAPAALPKKLLRTSPATHKQMGLEAGDAISNWIWKNPENFLFIFFSSSSDKYTEAVFFVFFFSFCFFFFWLRQWIFIWEPGRH